MDAKERFTDRAGDYSKYRPPYPEGVVQALVAECDLHAGKSVADVGSGTGIFSRLLMESEALVYGIEPNDAMRAEAEHELAEEQLFVSMSGSAESLPLDDATVDLVTAAQAFHWFDAEKAQREFERVLKPPGHVALVWNVRLVEATPFQRGYEELLRKYLPDYPGAGHDDDEDGSIHRFFAPLEPKRMTFENPQSLFWDEILGRALSASYFPRPEDPIFDPIVGEMRSLFEASKSGGRIDFDYRTVLFLGRLKV